MSPLTSLSTTPEAGETRTSRSPRRRLIVLGVIGLSLVLAVLGYRCRSGSSH